MRDVLCVQKTEISETETYGELSERLSHIGAQAIVDGLRLLQSGNYTLTPQGELGVNVVRKINKEQAKISFALPSKTIIDLVRGMNPAPVAYAVLDGEKVNIYRAERAVLTDEENAVLTQASLGEVLSDRPKRGLLVKCADGAVKLTEVQAAGGKRVSGNDFINGRKAKRGQVFEC